MARVSVSVALFLLSSCALDSSVSPPAPDDIVNDGPSNVDMVASMEGHYLAAMAAHDGLIQGDLEAFRSGMTGVAAVPLPEGSPEAWTPLHRQLQAAARDAGEVTSLSDAPVAMGSTALACGTCHEAIGRGPVYPVPDVPDADGRPLSPEMREHQWAVQMLWNGVTGPSPYAWEQGTTALAGTAIFPTGQSVDASMVAMEAALRALGEEGALVTLPSDRALVYGRILATCGSCHDAAGVTPPPM